MFSSKCSVKCQAVLNIIKGKENAKQIYMLRVVDDDIESPTNWACCLTSYGFHLSATPVLRAHMTSQSSSGQGLRNLVIG